MRPTYIYLCRGLTTVDFTIGARGLDIVISEWQLYKKMRLVSCVRALYRCYFFFDTVNKLVIWLFGKLSCDVY